MFKSLWPPSPSFSLNILTLGSRPVALLALAPFCVYVYHSFLLVSYTLKDPHFPPFGEALRKLPIVLYRDYYAEERTSMLFISLHPFPFALTRPRIQDGLPSFSHDSLASLTIQPCLAFSGAVIPRVRKTPAASPNPTTGPFQVPRSWDFISREKPPRQSSPSSWCIADHLFNVCQDAGGLYEPREFLVTLKSLRLCMNYHWQKTRHVAFFKCMQTALFLIYHIIT